MLSLFTVYFNFSPNQFFQLTPKQAYLILNQKTKHDKDNLDTQMYLNRLSNYYTVVAVAGTDRIKQPSDLYPLELDKTLPQAVYDDKQIEFLLSDDYDEFNRILSLFN